MNEIARKSDLKPLSVTTGPLPASTKVYSVAGGPLRHLRAIARDRAVA